MPSSRVKPRQHRRPVVVDMDGQPLFLEAKAIPAVDASRHHPPVTILMGGMADYGGVVPVV